jgi:hypothetical protein
MIRKYAINVLWKAPDHSTSHALPEDQVDELQAGHNFVLDPEGNLDFVLALLLEREGLVLQLLFRSPLREVVQNVAVGSFFTDDLHARDHHAARIIRGCMD